MLTLVKLSDVKGEPKFLTDLPSPLRVGDLIAFRSKLERTQGGRFEVLEILGRFRIVAIGFDAGAPTMRQVISLEGLGKAPSWRAVKKPNVPKRRLSPAKAPRKAV